jgi:hypothetical protein
MLLAFYPIETKAANNPNPSSMTTEKPVDPARAKALMLRLDEIKAMDKSNLKSSEKKVLRKEVRSIKKELQSPGLYISVGAAIIIVLLLVILL